MKKITSVFLALLLIISVFAACGAGDQTDAKLDANATLSLWTDEAESKKALVDYISAVIDESGADFIPVENRIAVFDLDGTLFCETDPTYFDYQLLMHRVNEDPDYKDKATDFEKQTVADIQTYIDTGESPEGLEVNHGKCIASSFAGFTVDEFDAYVKEFRGTPAKSYEGKTKGELFYKPMLEVIDLLQKASFTVFIVSGTDRLIVRGVVDGVLDIPMSQVIGSDETLVASDQGDTDGLDYVYDDDDKLVLGGDFIVKNLKMNKVSVIMQEIGEQPVLSFGNSSGDGSMAEYVTTDNQYKSLAFMLCCDDTERENGNEEKAKKMADTCAEQNWVAISMKNDWTTIYY